MVRNQNIHLRQDSMRRSWRPESLFCGYLVAALFCSPIVHADTNSVIWERGDQIVQLANQDDASAPPNDHPFNTTPGEIAAMLDALRMRLDDDETTASPVVSVFTKEEIDNLSSAVSTGLGRAAPSQDIIFHMIGVRRVAPGAFSRRNRVTAGRVFYRDGDVNIIFGQVQTPYRKRNVYGQTEQDFYPRNYGSRTQATEHELIFLTDSAADLFQDSGETRPDWIVIDPVAAATAATSPAADQSGAEPASAAPPPASSAAPVVLAEAPSTASSPPAGSSSDPVKQQTAGTSVEPDVMAADVEERLATLKRLRDRELISEEAYQAKMKEILQDL